jgi:hypothetical protein
VRTKEPHLVLGNTLRAFLDQLGLSSTGGKRGDITRLRNQMRRLFSSSEGQTLPSVSRQRPKGGPQRNVGVERVTFNQYRTPYVILVVLCALLATVIPFTLFGESSTLERLVWGGLEVLTLSFVPAFAKFAQFPVSLDVGARGIELVHRRGRVWLPWSAIEWAEVVRYQSQSLIVASFRGSDDFPDFDLLGGPRFVQKLGGAALCSVGILRAPRQEIIRALRYFGQYHTD